jgi:prevent-host-death family protein
MAARTVDLDNAKEHLAELLDQVLEGEDVVITRGDTPVARLVPYPQGRPKFGSAAGLIVMADDFDAPLEDFRDYMP